MLKRLVVLIFILSAVWAKGQSASKKIDDLNDDAEFFLEAREYDQAYVCYDKLTKLDPKNPIFKLQKGMCALHLPDKKKECMELFEEVRELIPDEPSILYYMGRAYHANYKFDDAIKSFKEFLAQKSDDKEMRDDAQHYLTNSQFGLNTVQTMIEADITNIGPPVNTSAQEYVPVISADESVLIYTYRGPRSTGGLMDRDFKPDSSGIYYEDIFISRKKKDSTWAFPESISDVINTKHHDASIALSPDGQELFTFSSDVKDGGDIYVCHLQGDSWTAPEKLGPTINTKYWEGSCSITADGRFLYFASERPGGQGRKDIYVSEKNDDGSWGPAKNLGPTINTKYDDDAPFIHPDGVTLFFSSEGHKSIGGFDIMYSIKKDGKWIDPVNMGYPLNTTDDDRYYVITAKGDRGYFSSNRESKGGNGSQDIFTVTPGILGEKPVLAMLVGNIYGNDVPIGAKIEIINKRTTEVIGPFRSNSKTGKYLIALSPGENYTIKVKAEGYEETVEDFDIAKLDKFVEVRKDFHLSKDNYKDPHIDTLKKLNELLNPKDIVKGKDTVKTKIPDVVTTDNPCAEFKTLDFTALKGKSLNDPEVYKKLMAIGRKLCAEGMIFKVQIAAYRFPKNYKWDHLKEFGAPEVTDYPDKITRFTQGAYKSIQDAEIQRQKAIAKGQTDAWITGFIDGKRFTLEELILVDFYNKNITRFNENLQFFRDYIVIN
ncbi:MAG: hypothetical protein ACJ76F_14445 [Bacteroidia bacterium]